MGMFQEPRATPDSFFVATRVSPPVFPSFSRFRGSNRHRHRFIILAPSAGGLQPVSEFSRVRKSRRGEREQLS